MHNLVGVQVSDGLAHISKVVFDLFLWEDFSFDLIEQCASVGILEDHVGGLLFSIDVVPKKLDDVGMVELIVKNYFVLCQFVNLGLGCIYDFDRHILICFEIFRKLYLSIRPKPYWNIMISISFQQLVSVQQNHVLIKKYIFTH